MTAVYGSNGQVLTPHVVALLLHLGKSILLQFFCLVALLVVEMCCTSSTCIGNYKCESEIKVVLLLLIKGFPMPVSEDIKFDSVHIHFMCKMS